MTTTYTCPRCGAAIAEDRVTVLSGMTWIACPCVDGAGNEPTHPAYTARSPQQYAVAMDWERWNAARAAYAG